MKMTKAFELFKESLENMSDENFAKLLDEIENDPQGGGITLGEFLESIHQNTLASEVVANENLLEAV